MLFGYPDEEDTQERAEPVPEDDCEGGRVVALVGVALSGLEAAEFTEKCRDGVGEVVVVVLGKEVVQISCSKRWVWGRENFSGVQDQDNA